MQVGWILKEETRSILYKPGISVSLSADVEMLHQDGQVVAACSLAETPDLAMIGLLHWARCVILSIMQACADAICHCSGLLCGRRPV